MFDQRNAMLDELAVCEAQLDQLTAAVPEVMRSESNPEELDGLLLEIEELRLELRQLRGRVT
jgi:hypothetical protein